MGHEFLVGPSRTDLDGHIEKSFRDAESLNCKCRVVHVAISAAEWPESSLTLPATYQESKVCHNIDSRFSLALKAPRGRLLTE